MLRKLSLADCTESRARTYVSIGQPLWAGIMTLMITVVFTANSWYLITVYHWVTGSSPVEGACVKAAFFVAVI